MLLPERSVSSGGTNVCVHTPVRARTHTHDEGPTRSRERNCADTGTLTKSRNQKYYPFLVEVKLDNCSLKKATSHSVSISAR